MFRLDHKVAIVTGAAQGMGYAIAHTLARQGAIVAAADIQFNQQDALSDEMDQSIKLYRADVSQVDQIKQLVSDVEADFGRIDILVNNAGVYLSLPFSQSTENDWEKLMSINAKSQYFFCQAVCSVMKAQGGGRIINLCSTGGRVGGFANSSIYSATKGAIAMFTKTIAREVACDNILVNAIAPGVIDTDMIRSLPKEKTQAICDQIPLGRLGKPEEIAAFVAFMASDECCYATGAMFDVNGGWVML